MNAFLGILPWPFAQQQVDYKPMYYQVESDKSFEQAVTDLETAVKKPKLA